MTRPDASPASSPDPRARHDGWTIARQLAFIRALYFSGCVTRAAAAAGMSRKGAYRLRARPGQHAFAGAWDLALSTRAAEGPKSESKGPTWVAEGHAASRTRRAIPSDKGHNGHGRPPSAAQHQFHQLAGPARSATTSRN